jgi:NADPH-dependent 2,4-dienoyl-CoA reductase/sulfur reductase-like enzyme
MALVVVGGVAAGLSAAARARRVDARLEIIVLEKGPVVSYGACGLPYFVEGRVSKTSQLITYTPDYFRQERQIDVRINSRVTSICHPRREVILESGARVPYEHLVIATGGRCDTRGIAGADAAPHVFTLHTIADAERTRAFLRDRRPATAAVVGAGYIGIEAADALRRNGLSVTVFEGTAHALLREDEAFTTAVRQQLEKHKVELRTGVRIANIDDLQYDMIVIAAGFKPNVELATAAGVETGRTGAIRTDDRMETNLRGVYAAGDCAEVTHLVSGRPAWIPLGTTANKCGRIAGANAAGARERFTGIVGTSIVSIFGTGFATTGFSAAQARAEGFTPVTARIEAYAKPKYYGGTKTVVELVADRASRRLVGGSVIGEDGAGGRINVIASALQTRMRIDEFEQLDLAYSPPFSPVWDPLLIAAQQLTKQL